MSQFKILGEKKTVLSNLNNVSAIGNYLEIETHDETILCVFDQNNVCFATFTFKPDHTIFTLLMKDFFITLIFKE